MLGRINGPKSSPAARRFTATVVCAVAMSLAFVPTGATALSPTPEPPAVQPPAVQPAESTPAAEPSTPTGEDDLLLQPDLPNETSAPTTASEPSAPSEPSPQELEAPDDVPPPEQPPSDAADDPGIGVFSVSDTLAAVLTDGTAVFDADDDPGNDSGPQNGIVRTNDTVQYRFNFNTNTASTNPYLTSTLPSGMEWRAAPPQCDGLGTVPNVTGVYDSVTGAPGGDRRVLICQTLSSTSSSSKEISPIALVTTASLNGESKDVSFSAGDQETPVPVQSNTVSTTVSAAAFYDLRKVPLTLSGVATGPGAGGTEQGHWRMYGIGITVKHPTRTGEEGLKGITQLASPITFTDDLGAYSPNARLMNWGTGVSGCTQGGTFGSITPLPHSSLTKPGANVNNAVVDSGVLSCVSDETPGGTFDLTLTGTDTRGLSYPTLTATNNPLPTGEYWVASGAIVVWIPIQDVLDAGGQLTVRNQFTDFDPDDVTGRSNYGDGTEPLENNSTALSINAGSYTASKSYRDYITGSNPAGATGIRTGDLRVSPGSQVISRLDFSRTLAESENVIVCDVFDRSSQQLTALSGSSVPTRSSSLNLPTDAYVIEFGAPASYPQTFAQMRATTCEDSDATWSTDPSAVALGGALTSDGFRDSVDRVRIRMLVPVPIGASVVMSTGLRFTGPSTLDPANNPDGTLLTNFGRFRTGTTPAWLLNSFDPVAFAGTTTGDRARLVPGEVRVDKTVAEQIPGSGGQVAPGTDASFTLQPTAATNGAVGDPLRDVVITDLMPATTPRLTVNPLSVTVPPGAQVEFCGLCDGSDWSPTPGGTNYGVRWLLGDVTPGTVIPALHYSARIPVDAANGLQYRNTAVASSPDDPSTEAQRSDSVTIQVVAGATVYATKSTATAYRPLAGPLVWDLTVRNATSNVMTRLDTVDVLPANGDGRLPASSFSGGFSGISVSGLPDTMVSLVTTQDPAVLDAQDGVVDGFADPGSPGDAWYVAPGTGIWSCAVTEIGSAGCPSAAEVTAVRFVSLALPAPQVLDPFETLTWQLSLVPTGDVTGDIYTNRFRGRVNPEVLALPVSSPDVPIQVQAPQIAVAKQTCTAADPNVCVASDDSVWAETHTVRRGGEGTFRIVVTNTSAIDGAVTVTDVLPAGLTFVPGSAEASVGDVAGFVPEWLVGQLAAGDSATLTFRVVIPAAGTQTNSVEAEIEDRFGQVDDASDTAALVAAPTDVTVEKSVLDSAVGPDGVGLITYELVVTNAGAFDEQYSLDDALAFGENISPDSPQVENVSPGDIEVNPDWNGDTVVRVASDIPIGAGDVHRYRVEVSVLVPGGLTAGQWQCDSGGGLANTATVSGDGIEDAAYACVDAPDSSIEVKKTGPATVSPGGEITWSIRVSNTGALDANEIVVTDALPKGLTFDSATEGGTAADNVVSWILPGLAAGTDIELRVTARLSTEASSPIANCVEVAPPIGWSEVEASCTNTTIVPGVSPAPSNPGGAHGGGLAVTGTPSNTLPFLLAGFGIIVGGALLRRRRSGLRGGR
ncbi:DUF11 domain-containing protein [Lysinibacter cavernae]|uniref:Putative repeat protein (TIGR01451 family) n=1 Tax=Lysinibacter cavernae TaxID=1640652 RepID=A0A7X5QZS2_9MICO|nr:DUF11 domain-containing protein [Lysinibacter cavernae]NIH52984.1 putative repeat protein (TIGR01451 family) [Lysinibacter cavernae]